MPPFFREPNIKPSLPEAHPKVIDKSESPVRVLMEWMGLELKGALSETMQKLLAAFASAVDMNVGQHDSSSRPSLAKHVETTATASVIPMARAEGSSSEKPTERPHISVEGAESILGLSDETVAHFLAEHYPAFPNLELRFAYAERGEIGSRYFDEKSGKWKIILTNEALGYGMNRDNPVGDIKLAFREYENQMAGLFYDRSSALQAYFVQRARESLKTKDLPSAQDWNDAERGYFYFRGVFSIMTNVFARANHASWEDSIKQILGLMPYHAEETGDAYLRDIRLIQESVGEVDPGYSWGRPKTEMTNIVAAYQTSHIEKIIECISYEALQQALLGTFSQSAEIELDRSANDNAVNVAKLTSQYETNQKLLRDQSHDIFMFNAYRFWVRTVKDILKYRLVVLSKGAMESKAFMTNYQQIREDAALFQKSLNEIQSGEESHAIQDICLKYLELLQRTISEGFPEVLSIENEF